MMSVSPPKTAEQFVRYHEQEFANGKENYYTEGDQIVGQWHGQGSAGLGLSGDVDLTHSSLLANGQHPVTAEQLVQHQKPRIGPDGETLTMSHRAGWDATFSAPKSVSVTGLVGGDAWVREQHEAAVRVALDVAVEPYIQARMGGNEPTQATHKLVAALFSHDSSRPVVTERFPDGYAAPQIHTHSFVFNVTQTADGRYKPLQTRDIYQTQGYATAVYRAELAQRLSARYHIIRDPKTGAPEIAGYSEAYLEASSPRRGQIEDWLDEHGLTGAKASEIAALETRDAKLDLTKEEVQRQHQQIAAEFGNQPQRVVRDARLHPPAARVPTLTAAEAVDHAVAHGFERKAVIDDRKILRVALDRAMLDRSHVEIHAEFERQIRSGALIVVPQRPGATGRKVTTPEMQRLERDNVERMARGQGAAAPLVSAHLRRDVDTLYPHLSAHQRGAADHLLSNTNRVHALQGKAGTGKTTLLAAIRDLAERDGYTVHGYAPSSRATLELAGAGMPTMTIQKYLARPDEGSTRKRLQILDESSLTSTVQMQAFLARQRPGDRILVVGDIRQHEAVDAGTPFKQLQQAGIGVTRLDELVRQKHPEVRAIVERLATGEVKAALALADSQGRVHGIADQGGRYQAITQDYLTDPQHTLVISPDNASRRDLNVMIHRALQEQGEVAAEEQPTRVLVSKDLTHAERRWVAGYAIGDVVRYTKGSKEQKIAGGDYGRVTALNLTKNKIRVRLDDQPGRPLRTVTYDPKRLQGVTVYREAERQFALHDRVQFSALNKTLAVANRERGTITAMTPKAITIALEHRSVTVPTTNRDRVHLDYGYAVTSHASQSETADRALIHADTTLGATLVNEQYAYVAGSRPQFDLQWYTDNRGEFGAALSRSNTQETAIDATVAIAPARAAAPSLKRGR